ncbi:MAG: ankyrin repeat domain-containing protein [Cyclobacteriaceae bacterium]
MEELTELIQTGNSQALIKKLDKNPSLADGSSSHGVSLLQFAAYCRNEEAVNAIRKHKQELDIFEAASLGEDTTVYQLLETDKNLLNSFSTDGFTILGLATFFGHLSLVEILIQKGADPNISANNQFRVTPLHSACAISNYEIADILLKHGADVNARQMSGVTPLHSAAHNGQFEISDLLIKHGADVNAKMEDGRTPLSMAEEEGSEKVISLIRESGGI